MKKLKSLTGYNFKLLFRDKASVIMAFLMPIGFYVLFAYMLNNFNVEGSSLSELLIPLYIVIIIGNAVINVFGAFYVSAKENGSLQKYKYMGISELRFSFTLFIATFMFQLVVIAAFVLFTFIYNGSVFPLDHIVPISITLLVIEIYHFAVTFFLISFLKKTTIFNPIALTFYMFQMFLGGLTFPIEMFPTFLQKLVYWVIPIVYGRDALLAAWTGKDSIGDIVKDNLILLSFALVLIVLGLLLNRLVFSRKTATAVSR